MNMKSKVLKIRNLPCNGKCSELISSKPYSLIVLFFTCGILLLFSKYYLIGAILAIVAGFYMLGVRNVKLVEFYEEYAVFYLNNGKDECFILFWEDVDTWSFNGCKVDLDTLNITLKDRRTIAIRCVSKKKIEKQLTRHIHTDTQSNASKIEV